MDKAEIEEHYHSKHSLYARLAENLKQALITFLTEQKISYHTISFRIKEFDSFYEKIERKGYENPLDQIEDFCGLRIVCFYPLDLDRISDIINDEFEILEAIDKSSALEPDRFGYRSNHYIVKIKKEWSKAPNYRGLENLKTEIQVRTILMHSWADIEHKLAYKNKEDIPIEFRRKLYQLSALLEIADSQFQELKNEKENFKQSLIINTKGKKSFDFSKDLNLDTLQAYLDFVFPKRPKTNPFRLLKELLEHNISLEELDNMRIAVEPFISEVEKEISSTGWAQVGVVRAILDLKSESYWRWRSEAIKGTGWIKTISKWKDIIQN
ncbi:hypothetical protein [Pedobacter frigiditerrae]|uniref:GTP pyrophosphokinase n=1 Tax=Pedobacter frigiditerrae TaxID=2530452 RepID=UPI00292D855F|nr:hypothetical protein [Pedobacter frigiditerrae]